MSADGLKPYAECRHTGLPWLGKIPVHWDVRRNARLFAERNQTGFPDLPILEVSIRTGVTVRDMDNQKRKQVMTDRSKYKRAVKGDIAYNMMRMWQGAVGVAPVDGLISPAYVVAGPLPEVDSRYYAYLFRTHAYMNEVNKYSRGIVTDRNRLYWDEFRQMPSTFPPVEEQTAISNYLDYNAALVAQFVRTKRRQIQLLNEQKRAAIEYLVTHGIEKGRIMTAHPDVWIGAVPIDWQVHKLKRVAAFNPSKAEIASENTPTTKVAFLPMERVSIDGKIDCSELRPTSELRDGYTYFRRHDVVVAKITPCFENGKGAYLGDLATDFGFGTTEFVVLRPSRGLRPKFLYFITQTGSFLRRGAEQMSGAAGQQRVPLEFMRNYPVALPPTNEQDMIVQQIEAELREIDVAVETMQIQINRIREHRARLVADVVTGKLDVRQAPIEPLETVSGIEAVGEDAAEVAEASLEEPEEVTVGNE